jgi:predicted flap endonuclease-1-like 5' DNA nuclease
MFLKFLSASQSKKISILIVGIIVIVVQAACLTTSAPPAAPVVDETKMALGVAATSNAIQQTEAAKVEEEKQAAAEEDLQNTMDAISVQQTVMAMQEESNANPTQEPVVVVQVTAEPAQPTDTPDPKAGMDEKIRNAKVLIFEDTSIQGIGQWIEDTVRRMGIKNYTQTNDFSGDFMEQLNSPTKWDLILVGAESKTKIQGEFWDAIMERVDKKVAIVAEVWYLDLLGGGRIKAFTSECGVGYASNYDLAESIYWWDIESPVFTTPNIVDPLIHYNRYWANQCGDKMRITGGGDAQMLAGYRLKPDSRGGFIASCMGGRTIIQTFSNHDYHEDQIKDLWENYITYTLTNHFLAMP